MSSILHAARANVFLAPVGTVLAVAASILVARCLGPQVYADYATLMAIVSWLLLLGEGGCNIGLGRFMHKASQLGARYSFYKALQLRRGLLMLALVLPLLSLGPEWARTSGLSPTHWTAGIFTLIGLLAGAMLHGQLAGSALMATFNHQDALLINQSMTITRALLLAALASTIREPWALVCALLVLATVEALTLHWFAIKIFFKERSVIPSSMLNSAQKHGLVALFDKLTTAFGGGPFLLLVLAGVHSRTELAMLGLATDLLQKALSVVGLPVSNLVLPVLNANRVDLPRFRLQIGRLGGLTTVLFAVAIGGLAAAIPNGLPLLVGASYAAAVPVAMIWLLPLFFEAGVRMVWGAALLTQDRYRWLIGFNLLYGAISLLLVFFMRTQTSLFTLLGILGVLRLVMSLLLLIYARRLHLLPPESRPLGVMLAAAAACVLSLLLQTALDLKPLAALLVGMGSYLLVILALFRWVPLVPQLTHEALCQVAGKYRGWLVVLIPQAAKGR